MAALAYTGGKREINYYFSVRSAKALALGAVLLLTACHAASRRYRGEGAAAGAPRGAAAGGQREAEPRRSPGTAAVQGGRRGRRPGPAAVGPRGGGGDARTPAPASRGGEGSAARQLAGRCRRPAWGQRRRGPGGAAPPWRGPAGGARPRGRRRLPAGRARPRGSGVRDSRRLWRCDVFAVSTAQPSPALGALPAACLAAERLQVRSQEERATSPL